MKKQYVIVGGVGILLVIIILVFVFSQKSPTQSGTTQTPITPIKSGQTPIKPGSSVDISSPTSVATAFYSWYISYPGNPLSSGAYKTSPYLADSFKQTIANFSNNSTDRNSDPVFCTPNKTKIFAADLLNSSSTISKANVMIHEKSDGGRNLYRVVLMNSNNTWIITDVMCQP